MRDQSDGSGTSECTLGLRGSLQSISKEHQDIAGKINRRGYIEGQECRQD